MKLTRRQFLGSVSAGTVGVLVYTADIEPHWVEVTERAMPVEHLPRDLVGRRLVQLSDLHIGNQVDGDYLQSVFARVRALRPDFVVYTGDFISHSQGGMEARSELFAHFPLGSLGTFGVLGNHDFGVNWAQPDVAREVVKSAQAAGVRILRNEVGESEGLHVVGVDDLWAGQFDLARALEKVPPKVAAVLLNHNPDGVDLEGWETFRGWILAGHTHGGQCKPPFLPPPLLPVKNRRYTAGEFALPGHRRIYINRGIGHLLGVRFNVRPEITVFTLHSA